MFKILKKIKRKIKKPRGSFSCSVCGTDAVNLMPLPQKYLRSFDKFGFVHSIFLFETLNLFNYSCEKCSSADRSRLMALYLTDYFNKNNADKSLSLLDIAPTKHLQDYFKKHIVSGKYRTADLAMEGVDDKIDIQDMKLYEDNTWDVIICSHVLEHVKNDQKAIDEIYRVLKEGGIAILMVPIILEIDKSVEADKNKSYTEAERWKYFGQEDHERLYSKSDFMERITNSGFKMNALDINYFGKEVYERFGISRTSVLYVVKK
ncbi:class I SAM-dependent methyltransferase [Flavivirga eckloniae]|uniref:SAM-dependent methyltransferase n=1 Tax=Flavivirga eckloniae TaxID=1803846 RepID=A0A2K9PM99_9FLAO|nr:class I SAM-dependent methyltransferase [Flavivirga eckloniae]AUP78182.1 SAM-dependent methyltransferase [Flavivirga eckloniae]